MVGKTRAQTARAAQSPKETSNRSPRNYVAARMLQITSFFQTQKGSDGIVHIGEDLTRKVDEIADHCLRYKDQVDAKSLGELIRCLDDGDMCFRFSPAAYALVFRILQISVEDVFRNEGLKLLSQTLLPLDAGSSIQDGSANHASDTSRKLLACKALIPLLSHSILDKTNDETCIQIMQELLAEIVKVNIISVTESPMDVSESTFESPKVSARPTQNVKHKRSKIPDTYEEPPTVWDMDPEEGLQEELGSSILRKPNRISFSANGPRNQAISSRNDRSRVSTGRATEQGSPLPPRKRLRTMETPLPKNQEHTIKKKDRLLASATKSSIKVAARTMKTMVQTVDRRTTIPEVDMVPDQHPGNGSDFNEEAILTKSSTNTEKLSTPPAGRQASPEIEPAQLQTCNQFEIFDKYIDLNAGYGQPPADSNGLFSPEKAAPEDIRGIDEPTKPAIADPSFKKASANTDDALPRSGQQEIVDLTQSFDDAADVIMTADPIQPMIGTNKQRSLDPGAGKEDLVVVRSPYKKSHHSLHPKLQTTDAKSVKLPTQQEPTTIRTKGVQTDPEITLVNPVIELDDQSDASSTTTGSTSPAHSIEDTPDTLRELIEPFLGMDEDTLSILQGPITLLFNTIDPIRRAGEIIEQRLVAWDVEARELISAFDQDLQNATGSQVTDVSGRIQTIQEQINKLQTLHSTGDLQHTIMPHGESTQIVLIDKLLSGTVVLSGTICWLLRAPHVARF